MKIKITPERKKDEPKDFASVWLEAVEKKGNNIVAGFDPKNENMDRFALWEMGKQYIDDVAKKVPAIKFNTKFFTDASWSAELGVLCAYAREKGLLVIGDSKFADIGDSLSAGLQGSVKRKMDFETFDTKTSRVTKKIQNAFGKSIGLFSVVLMSNDEARQYNSTKEGKEEALRYLAHVLEAGVCGVVIGGTYKNEAVFLEALDLIKKYQDKTGKKILILSPGYGKQGGNVLDFLYAVKSAGLDPKQCMLNVGREFMNAESGEERDDRLSHYVGLSRVSNMFEH